MPARKIRVELHTGLGERYTITFEGEVTREKALQLLDLVELLGGGPTANIGWNTAPSELSKIDKIRLVVERRFPFGRFSSKDIQLAYEEEFRDPISLSTVSTYLSRMTDRGLLAKNRGSNRRRFRILTNISKAANFVKNDR